MYTLTAAKCVYMSMAQRELGLDEGLFDGAFGSFTLGH